MKSALLALAVLVVGCSSPSSYDLCIASCNVQARCQPGFTATDTSNCKIACDNQKGTLSDDDKNCDKQCTNCASIRSSLSGCGDKECSQIATCVNAVDQTCAV